MSCILIALTHTGGGVIAGRALQGAAGATLLACGMSLLSVASTGPGQMKAVALWGAASAVGAAAGPLVGGVLVEVTGWQGLFWINAGDRGDLHPDDAWRRSRESRDPNRSPEIDLPAPCWWRPSRPVHPRAEHGYEWGWLSAGNARLLRDLRRRPLASSWSSDGRRRHSSTSRLLRNGVLVGATLAILIGAGAINALMYLLSLYFQNPAAFGCHALEAGLATLPATVAMIASRRCQAARRQVRRAAGDRPRLRRSRRSGSALSSSSRVLAYGAFVLPLIADRGRAGLANGPASSASTSSVTAVRSARLGHLEHGPYVGGALRSRRRRPFQDGVTRQPPRGRREWRPARLRCPAGRASRSAARPRMSDIRIRARCRDRF